MQIEVHRHIRQRHPFLFVDSASAADDLSEVETEVLFSSDFDFFAGHFPGDPIVPGVILIETMAQSARLLMNLRSNNLKPGYLMSVELAKFNSPVRANDVVKVKTRLVSTSNAGTVFKSSCFNLRMGNRCARAQFILI